MCDVEVKWKNLILKLEKQFDDEMTLKGILYLIGVQELGFGIKRFNKEEKLDVLHVATCTVLSFLGFYRFDSVDEDGWPHFTEIKAIKNLSEKEQALLIKKGILKYFNN